MNSVLVLGNGQSRLQLDLAQCIRKLPVYGCNALYRDFVPSVLVATDRPIAEEIQTSGYSNNNRFYTRRPVEGSGALLIPTQWKGWSSGPIAAAIACSDGHDVVYLAGFDMGGINGHFNNVYADTEFYKQSNDKPTFSGNWARQFVKLCEQYPNVEFIRLISDSTASVEQLNAIKNFSHLPIGHFQSRLNNNGDI